MQVHECLCMCVQQTKASHNFSMTGPRTLIFIKPFIKKKITDNKKACKIYNQAC